MKIEFLENEIKITGCPDFDLKKTFECGQCFRWKRDEHGAYTGVAFSLAATLRQDFDTVYLSCSKDDFDNIWYDYFDLSRDYAKIRKNLCEDYESDFMKNATAYGTGIRILRQEPWEALFSFILSQRSNIPRISKSIDILCREFGSKIKHNGEVLYSFPTAQTIAGLTLCDLAVLRCGYRDKYLLSAAKAVAGASFNLDILLDLEITEARAELKKLLGVGDKVADCVMLFGLHKLDTFPIDVWISRALARYFGQDFDPSVFSPHAGIAQQYIFHYMRNGV